MQIKNVSDNYCVKFNIIFLYCFQSQLSSPVRSDRHTDAMTSPAPDIDEPFEDEGDLFGENNEVNEEDEGEELFGDNMEA